MISIEISTSRYKNMIEACNDWLVLEYFDNIFKYPLLIFAFPFFLIFLCLYGIYLLFYGILAAILFVQEGDLFDIVIDIESAFLRIPLLIIWFPIVFIFYLISAACSLPVLILLNIFHGIIYLIQLPFHALKNKEDSDLLMWRLKELEHSQKEH